MDIGQKAAAGVPITNPLPPAYMGLALAPPTPPAWAKFGSFTTTNIRNLLAQIAYDQSNWNYNLVGLGNLVGKYQFPPLLLESYGLLAIGSNAAHGTDCINYKHCWRPVVINTGINSYENYFYNITSLQQFLTTHIAQEHLAYQVVYDLYNALVANGSIQAADSDDVVAGMIYVGWTLGAGVSPTYTNASGTGAYAWRYFGIGDGANAYNSGRYAVTFLSQ